ncbi:unnamed protein product [Mortierella alpina]
MSQGSHRPPMSSQRPGRTTPSVDYRTVAAAAPREYPSIAQESLPWSSNPPTHSRNASTASYQPYQPTRPRDGRESAMASLPPREYPHQEQAEEDEEDEEEADRNIIQIAYVRRMTQESTPAGPYGSFYEGVGQDDAAYAPLTAATVNPPRPYSPRHV